MAKTDNEKYIIRKPAYEGDNLKIKNYQSPPMTFISNELIPDVNYHLQVGWIHGMPEPATCVNEHVHNYDQIIIYWGGDYKTPQTLGAEIEFTMGEEMEKHVFNTSTLVYLPAGFVHGPWIIRKVERPFLVMVVCQEPEHTEKARPDLVSDEQRQKLMFIDQNYDSPERIVTTPEGLGEW